MVRRLCICICSVGGGGLLENWRIGGSWDRSLVEMGVENGIFFKYFISPNQNL